MTYDFNKEILNNTKKISLLKDNSCLINIRPLYIIFDGSIYFNECKHIYIPFRQDFEDFYDLLISSEHIDQIKEKYNKKMKELKEIELVTDISKNDFLEYSGLNLTEKNIKSNEYSIDTLNLINSTIQIKKIILNHLYNLVVSSPNYKEIIYKLIDLFYDYPIKDKTIIKNRFCNLTDDLLTRLIGMDKIIIKDKTNIITTRKNIYQTYYNYLLNDIEVSQVRRIEFDDKNNNFYWIDVKNEYESDKEVILKQEVKSLKKQIPLNERYKFYI